MWPMLVIKRRNVFKDTTNRQFMKRRCSPTSNFSFAGMLLEPAEPILNGQSAIPLAKWPFKDIASFCYCAYVLRISGYSGFLRNLPTNTTIFAWFTTIWKNQILARAIRIQKENGGNHAFFRDNWAYIWKEIAIHSFYFNAFLELWLLNYLWQMRGYPHFSFWIPMTLAKIYFFLIVITFVKIIGI